MDKYQRAAANIRRWRADPVQFVRDVFSVEPDEWQKDFLLAYAESTRIAAKACKGPGKTAVLAWCCWHFLACYTYPKIAATSITGDNLRDGLWTEMAKWQQRSPFLLAAFTWKAERITANDHVETWWMSARRWSKDATGEQQANALAGLHADNIMFVVDEAGGVPDAVIAAAEAALANAGTEVNPDAVAKLLICGNPTHLSGPLYRACTVESRLWRVIEITGDPDDPKRSPRISRQWALEQIEKYGRDNAWVMVNVFGKFPPASLNALIGPDEVTEAMSRVVREDAYRTAPKILGVDVARQGDDATIIQPRQGIVAFKPRMLRIPNTMTIAHHVAQAMDKFRPDAVFIDGTGGWGYGVIDKLEELGRTVIPVQFAGKALQLRYKNKRAEMWMEMVGWIRRGGVLPEIMELREELTAQTFFHTGDKLQLTDKDQIKEELGRSPDYADALALTFAFPVAKRDPYEQYRTHSNDYNPLDGLRRRDDVGRDSTMLEDYNPLSYHS